MKLFCFLLLLLVLALSVHPCCTDQRCERETVTAKALAAQHNNQPDDCTGCSPFFSCGSCTGFTLTVFGSTGIEHVAEKFLRKYTAYISPQLPDISLSIWQPPQLN